MFETLAPYADFGMKNVVRFAPVIYGPEQMQGMHGENENISIDKIHLAVDFYKELLRELSGGGFGKYNACGKMRT